jgi:hypothetical protein
MLTRDKMPTIPEDLSEFARVHTGPDSWSAETNFESVPPPPGDPEMATPQPPFVALRDLFGIH